MGLEDGVLGKTALRARGHGFVLGVAGFNRSLFGRGQITHRERDGRLVGGSDPRRRLHRHRILIFTTTTTERR